MLINLSADGQILSSLADDNDFVECLIAKVTVSKPFHYCKEPTFVETVADHRQIQDKDEQNADDVAMLLANLAKADSFHRIVSLTRAAVEHVSTSTNAFNQLMDCFVKGADGSLNKNANFNYLAYLFADLSKTEEGRTKLTTKQEYDSVVPVTKLLVFTEHRSDIRRRGVAWTIKNVCFDVKSHPTMIRDEDDDGGANLLPYLLLPLMGPEEYPDDETSEMLPDLQLLPPDKKREPDHQIIVAHLESLLLLTTTREARDKMRQVQVYPIIRECHLYVENEEVREACDRLVQVLMRCEEGEEDEAEKMAMEAARTQTLLGQQGTQRRAITEVGEEGDEDDEKIVDILD